MLYLHTEQVGWKLMAMNSNLMLVSCMMLKMISQLLAKCKIHLHYIDGCKVLFSIKPYLTHYQLYFRAYLLSERTDVQENLLYLSNLFIDTPNLKFYRKKDLYCCHMHCIHFKMLWNSCTIDNNFNITVLVGAMRSHLCMCQDFIFKIGSEVFLRHL